MEKTPQELKQEGLLERWKAIIDFSKTVLGLTVSILTLLLGALIVGSVKLTWPVYTTGGLLLLSVFFALKSFGKGVDAIGDNQDNTGSVLYANISAGLLVVGILFLVFAKKEDTSTVDGILAKVQSTTKSTAFDYDPRRLKTFKISGDNCELTYEDAAKVAHVVIYSLRDERVVDVR